MRGRLGLSQGRFAARVGVSSRNVVNDWEAGRAHPRAQTLDRIARLGGVTAEWLLHGKRRHGEAEMSETVSFVQIVTAVTPQGPLLYGLTTSGAVYEYNFSGEVWIPLPMRALPPGSPGVSVVGLRGPGVESEPGSVRRRE